jgi:hypothetical protein
VFSVMDAILAYLDQECVVFDLSVLTSVVFSKERTQFWPIWIRKVWCL